MNILRKLKLAKFKNENYVYFTDIEDIVYRHFDNHLTNLQKEIGDDYIRYYLDKDCKFVSFSINNSTNKITIISSIYAMLEKLLDVKEMFDLFAYMARDKNYLEKNVVYSFDKFDSFR